MEIVELKTTGLQSRFNEYSAFVLKGGYLYDEENKTSVRSCIEVLEQNESGLLALGNPGSGKTLIFEMCQRIINPHSPNFFIKVNVLDVVLQFNNKEIGHKVFSKWSKENVLFDDLGTEKEGFLYQKIEVMELFIQYRYDLFRKTRVKTHFTTNLNYNQLKERYGIRCVSRLEEMCSIVILGGGQNYSDRRRLKNFIGLPPVKHEKPKDDSGIDYDSYKLNRNIELEEQKEQDKLTLGQRLRLNQEPVGNIQAEIERVKEKFKKGEKL